MAKSIKISESEMVILREEAELTSRSLSGQAEHWLRIGRAIENSPDFSFSDIKKVLLGLTKPESLNVKEKAVLFSEFERLLTEDNQEQSEFFANRKKQGLGVGLDDNGNIIHQKPEE